MSAKKQYQWTTTVNLEKLVKSGQEIPAIAKAIGVSSTTLYTAQQAGKMQVVQSVACEALLRRHRSYKSGLTLAVVKYPSDQDEVVSRFITALGGSLYDLQMED